MANAVIYTIQSNNGLIWGAAFDIKRAQDEINKLKEVWDGEFYITKTDILDVEVRA